MSWPEEDPQAPPGGRGRRRRSDAPEEQADDAYASGEYQVGGAGHRGTGEFERPAEYVQQPGPYVPPQDDDGFQGYARPAYVRHDPYARQDPYVQPVYAPPEPQGYAQQDTYVADPYAADPYAADPYAADPYAADQHIAPDPYAAQASPSRPNLNSSGFYPVADPDQNTAQSTTGLRTMRGSTEATVPAASASSSASASASVSASAAPQDGATGAEEDVSGWLEFVESRADQRQERDRRFRFRMIVLGVVLAVIGGGAGVWFLLAGDGKSAATETTVLFQLKDIAGNAVGNAVLVADRDTVAGKANPSGKGAALLVPAQLSVTVTGLDTQPFGGAMSLALQPDPAAGAQAPTTSAQAVAPAGKDAVSGLLGVEVDGVWSVDEITFAAFLSSIGDVIVDTNIAVPGPGGKPVVPQGSRVQLTGAQAVVYATYQAPGETADKQLARFGQVLTAMLAKVPVDKGTTEKLLNLQATVPDPSLPNDRLASILSALAAEQQGSRFQVAALPLRSDGSDTMDLEAASPIVKQLLGGAVHAKDDGGLPRVAVYDATGRRDTMFSRTVADAKLQSGGYAVVDSGGRPAAPTTVVTVPSEGQRSLGNQIAMTLGLQNSAVKVATMDTTLDDAVVVLGADWGTIGGLPADVPETPEPGASSAASAGPGSASVPKAPTGTAGRTSHPPTSTTKR